MHTLTLCFAFLFTGPKDDFAYRFLVPWIGNVVQEIVFISTNSVNNGVNSAV